MTPEERALLERTAALAEENNKLLKSMQRSARWRTVFQVIYWVVIIGLTFGAFFFIPQYISSLTGALGIGSADGGQSFSQQLQQALMKF